MNDINFYAMSCADVIEHFHTSNETGLSTEEISNSRTNHGANSLITQKQKSKWLLFIEQFNDPIIYILVVAAIFNAILAELKDTIVIGFVVVLNSLIGFIQERRASDALKALLELTAPTAKVLRNGSQQTILTEDVVCGDIILLESGIRSPADARLIDSYNLLVDESMLTGESFSVVKHHNAVIPEKAHLAERFTMIYSGTIIQKGRGTAVVTAVGHNTEFGKISQNVLDAEETVSPLQEIMEKFGKGLSIGIMSIVGAIFIIGFLRHIDWLTMFLTSVGLAVSAIPEGLPVSVTITLSIGMSQMAKRNAIVKRLSAVETLGSTNVICTDKTGTLTKNQMIVNSIMTNDDIYEFTGSGYSREGKAIRKSTKEEVNFNDFKPIEAASMVSALCTETSIIENDGIWEITGDPTEAALMIAAKKLNFNSDNWQISVDIPFESENQLMAVRAEKEKHFYFLAKGAPEKILAKCNHTIDKNGNLLNINTNDINQEISVLSSKGLRILAMAYKQISDYYPVTMESLNDMVFIGFAGIEDSIRPEAVKAVQECHNAGVRVVMITGDHAKTAQTVAKTIGIAPEKETPEVITGDEIDFISDEELFRRTPDIDVYARVVPHHKFRIVKNIQAQNNTVAMTGDGVNDAPALKQADIGVAMGSGTDVAKEAAQMVLTDDNFASIVNAVRRGRIILHNLQHILLYILSTSTGGLLTIAVSVIIGFPLPILPAQILWINLVTDGTSTFPLAFEREHGNIMVYKPRRKSEPLVTRRMLYRIILCGLIMMFGTLSMFYWSIANAGEDIFGLIQKIDALKSLVNPSDIQKMELHRLGAILSKAQTIAFCVLAFFQIWNVQNSRSVSRSLFFNLPIKMPFSNDTKMDRISPFKNPILLGVMLLAVFLQVSAVAAPFMNELLDSVFLGFNDWLLILSVTFSIIIIVEASKFFFIIRARITKKSFNEILETLR